MAFWKLVLPVSLLSIILVSFSGCGDSSSPTTPAIDNIEPAVEWVYPHGGSELSGVVDLRFRAFDEGGVDSACVYINGSPFLEGGHSCPSTCTDTLFTLTWNTLDFDDGVYILEARAWDDGGNMGTSPSLVVNVRNGDEPPPEDRLPPDVWWTAPDPGSTLVDTVRLRLGIFDECEVDSVLLLKNGAAVATIIPPCASLRYHTNIPPYVSRGGQRGGRTRWSGETETTPDAIYDKPVQLFLGLIAG